MFLDEGFHEVKVDRRAGGAQKNRAPSCNRWLTAQITVIEVVHAMCVLTSFQNLERSVHR
jgi:hypothetical protein